MSRSNKSQKQIFDVRNIGEFNAEDYINSESAYRAITVYGTTGTGKTTIITDILKSLVDHVDIGSVICPTEASYGDIFPEALIHQVAEIEIIEKIVERQKMTAKMWNISHEPKIDNLIHMRTLYACVPNHLRNPKKTAAIMKFTVEADKKLRELEKKKGADIKEEQEKIIETEMKYYRDELSDPDVKSHLYAIKGLKTLYSKILDYVDAKPGFVLILDDCTELYAELAKRQTFNELFYRGRHYKMILILSVHSAAKLVKSLRQNVALAICASPGSFMNFADNDSNFKKIGQTICNAVFTEDEPYQKIVIDVPKALVYKYTAKKHRDTRFCSEEVWEFLTERKKKKFEGMEESKHWR